MLKGSKLPRCHWKITPGMYDTLKLDDIYAVICEDGFFPFKVHARQLSSKQSYLIPPLVLFGRVRPPLICLLN